MILPRILEEALHEGGPDGTPGRPDKPRTPDPRAMKSSNELLDAFGVRMRFYLRQLKISWDLAQEVLMSTSPDPCNSFLLEAPLSRGVDVKRLHKEHDTYPAVFCLGLMTTADSLAAVQKRVFDDGRYAMEDLIGALASDWEGREDMRQAFLHAPKYGNDDAFADGWAVKTAAAVEEAVRGIRDAWGCRFIGDGGTAAGYQTVGLACGATPDGRRAMSHLTDGSRSPMAGADRKGPTAVLRSAAKIPFTHMELFTVVDSAMLRAAQERPAEHADLQVRVAGYSAFWVDLPKGTQDSIIARTEHALGRDP